MQYTTAIRIKINYPINSENLPEELLETENLKWAFNYLTYFMNKALKNQTNKDSNWQLGLEGTFVNGIWNTWNSRDGYALEVLDFSKNCQPIK